MSDSSVRAERLLLRLLPGLAALLRYNRGWLLPDLLAGLSVAAVALPVAIAYAEIAGAPAIVGIYSAAFPLLAYAIFGSSRQLIIGPDAATCLLVAASLTAHANGDPERYLALMPVLTLITGIVYLCAGAGRLGFIASFFSRPILIGYLNGIALIIFVGQLSKLFGYPAAAHGFGPQIREFLNNLGAAGTPTAWLGLSEIAILLVLRRIAPTLPGPLVAVVGGVAAVAIFDLHTRGVAVTGALPSGLPAPQLPDADADDVLDLLRDAVAIMLVSFASGMLTAKSFAQRNRYAVDANRELIAFGAANLMSGLVHGFVVTGADSRTAVNNVVGGKSQLVGIVAAGTMLLALVFLRGPLALVPTTTLAAVVLVSALALFDVGGLLLLARMSWREGVLSVGTMLGVVVLGVVPGVAVAIALSLLWLLIVASRPNAEVLGRIAGRDGFHSVAAFPESSTVPGLLIFRFEGALLFFNVEYFEERLRAAIAASDAPVSSVIVDADPVNWLDATALQHLYGLYDDLSTQGITLGFARISPSLARAFNASWISGGQRKVEGERYGTLEEAESAFRQGHRP